MDETKIIYGDDFFAVLDILSAVGQAKGGFEYQGPFIEVKQLPPKMVESIIEDFSYQMLNNLFSMKRS
jgi:hypothetical protein